VTELANEWYEEAQWYKERLVRMLINEENSTEFKGPTMASVIEDVRRHSLYITIPTTAPREIEALDTNMAAVVWAKDLTKLFASMERYATARISGEFDGSYLEWCSEVADYSAAKIAMQESEPTKRNPRLRASRTFEVSRDLDPSGWKVMFAHAKTQFRHEAEASFLACSFTMMLLEKPRRFTLASSGHTISFPPRRSERCISTIRCC